MDTPTLTSYNYRSYGLNIQSYIPLPDLSLADFKEPDLVVHTGSVMKPPPAKLPDGEGCWQGTDNDAYYFWSEVGSMRVRSGNEIIIDPNASVTHTTLRLTIQGPGLATALYQRNHLVLHASAFLTDTGAVAFVGPSGSGKSTSLSALLSHNFLAVTDDLLIVDPSHKPSPSVLPGPALVKLWPSVVSAQGRNPDALPTLGQGYLKLVDRHDRGPRPDTVPLRRIYLVVPDDNLSIETIPPSEALMNLMTHSYCSELLRFVGEPRNFVQCTQVVKNVVVRRLRRGKSLEHISDLADLVISDLSSDR